MTRKPEQLAVRLRLARAMYGHTQEQASLIVGCTHNSYVRYECNASRPCGLYATAVERYITAAPRRRRRKTAAKETT